MKTVLGYVRESSPSKIDAVHYYRIIAPLRAVHRHDNGISAVVGSFADFMNATEEEIGHKDAYMLCRSMAFADTPSVIQYVDEVHRRGGLVVLDSDDDLTETYKMVGGHGDEFKETLGLVDYVTCTTEPLADLFTQYTKKQPVVLKNCVDVDWMQERAAKGKRLVEGLTLGFTGSPTHWGDWRTPAVPFARIGKDYPEVTLILHGECPRYLGFADQKASLLKLGGVPFSLYPVLLGQFDIVLCAVDSRDKFNDGKSAVKALECMALGVVPICSRFRPYLDLEAAGAPVIVVEEDSQDGWYEAMQMMIEDIGYLEHMSSIGPAWVRQNRDMTVTGYKQWESFYNEIID
jgi:glycosyltransferase involved in cell wall biosynthesis